jgi:hypothetical protein
MRVPLYGVDAAGKIVVKRRLRRAGVVEFFKTLEPVLWALKPARRRITGRVSASPGA